MDTTPFYFFLFIHLSSLILGFGSVLVTDLYGMLWIRDRVRFTQIVRVSGVTERFIWVGWLGMIASGIPLALLKGEIDELMTVKLFFVGLIGINGLFLHRLQKRMQECKPGDEVPNRFMFRLGLALFVSQIGWWGAMAIGFLHRHVQTIIEWPAQPLVVCTAIVAAILALWGLGDLVFRHEPLEPATAD